MEQEKHTRRPRVVAVGCGPWGRNIIRNLADLGALAALVNRRNADAVAHTYRVPVVSFEEAITDPGIQAIVIAAPPLHHPWLATQALKSGKHVYVEKAIALASEQIRELCSLAAAVDRRLMVGHILQYHPAFLKVLELVRSGRLGRLLFIQASRMNLGRIRRKEEDVVWSLAPHDVSMLHALTEGEPRVVSAVAGYHLRADVADTVHAHLEFEGGIAAHLALSWYHPVKEQRLIVVGTEGMIVFDDAVPWERKLVLYRHTLEWHAGQPKAVQGAPEPIDVEPAEPLKEELQHFLGCIETGTTPRTDGFEALKVVQTIEHLRGAMVACGNLRGGLPGGSGEGFAAP